MGTATEAGMSDAAAAADDCVLLAAPVWTAQPVRAASASASASASADEHAVLLYGWPQAIVAALRVAWPRTQWIDLGAGSDQGDAGAAYAQLTRGCLQAVQSLLQRKPMPRTRVQLAVADTADAATATGLGGLFASVGLENPDLIGQVLLLPADSDAAALEAILRSEREAAPEPLLRHAGGQRWVRRWDVLDPAPAPHADSVFKHDGTYLISGGLGGLGRLFAREILSHCPAARIVLCGRSQPDAAGERALAQLREGGARVDYLQADIADEAACERLIAQIQADGGRLRGIVHAAGVLRDDFALKLSAQRLDETLAPKIAGAVALDRASRAVDLDFFCLCSSIAGWAGNLGQSGYAAANGFLDAYAERRAVLVMAGERHGHSLSIAWPHWRDGGMGTNAASMAALRRRTGLGSLATADAMRAFARLLTAGPAQALVLSGDEAALRAALQSTAPTVATPSHAVPVLPHAAAVDDAELERRTREFLRAEFAAVLKLPAERIEARAPLEKYGIDSILAMSLTARLEASFGTLAKTLFFEYLSLDELSGYFLRAHAATLRAMFAPAAAAPAAVAVEAAPATTAAPAMLSRRQRRRFLPLPAATEQAVAAPAPVNEPIAIVGLSGRYPQSRDLDAFWRNLRDGRDCIEEVPASRWNWREHYSDDPSRDGAHRSKWGGFIEGADEFDPRFFNIAPREAASIDPQERLFLQHAWMAVEDAGYTRASLQIAPASGQSGQPGQVGVYAGVMYGEYNLSGSLASIANRVSWFLNLHGPSLTLDTMCSSSLTAIHLACQDLRLGRTRAAIAGGVNLSIHPNKYRMLSGGQFLSSDGHCQSFGEGGDGYIPGEGVGVVVLKRLSDAQRDGNHIYGLVRASALNHGGKTNGYTVPNPQAQADAIARALAEGGVDPRRVGYIEAHGTGTKLGDPIEIAALTRAFHADKPAHERDTGYCLIGSAKSNIGHCESAAGVAGVTKVLLQLRHKQIVPSLHSARLNPHIDFASTPFVVNQSLRDWPAPRVDGYAAPRIAGVSSFGAGGSNAHLLIEEYIAPAAPAQLPGEVLAPLSARTPAQLRERAQALSAWLDQTGDGVDLAALAHTLQSGREAMEERLAILAGSAAQLHERLQAWLDGRDAAGVYSGQVRAYREQLAGFEAQAPARQREWAQRRDLAALASWWVKGLEADWALFAGADTPRLLSLPAYPFARERYWNDPVAAAPSAAPAALHPLLHANTSDLRRHAYSSRFAGEPWLRAGDDGEPAVPALLALEMARAALALAASDADWELREFAWGEALAAGPTRRLHTALLPHDAQRVDVEIYSERNGDDERVHAQAQAHRVEAVIEALDPAALRAGLTESPQAAGEGIVRWYEGEGRWLLELQAHDADTALLGPRIAAALEAALQRIGGGAPQPLRLGALQTGRARGPLAFVSLRRDGEGRFDLDLCDAEGGLALRCLGLECAFVPLAESAAPTQVAPTVEAPAASQQAPATVALADEPREIVLRGLSDESAVQVTAATEPASLAKPTGIVLLASAPVAADSPRLKARIALAAPGAAVASVATAPVAERARLFALGEGVFRIELQHGDIGAAAAALAQALRRIAAEPEARAVLLQAPTGAVWYGDDEAVRAMARHGVFAALAECAAPVIAVPRDGATGAGLLLAAACDFMVGGEQALYAYAQADADVFPQVAEARFFQARLGAALAQALLYRGATLRGAEFKAYGLAARMVASDEVATSALELAQRLARGRQPALALLKRHLDRDFADALAAIGSAAPVAEMAAAPRAVHLDAADAATLHAALEAELAHAATQTPCALLLTGSLQAEAGDDEQTWARIAALLRDYPAPIVYALDGEGEGAPWWLALHCDSAVLAPARRYGCGTLAGSLLDAVAERAPRLLGAQAGRELCLSGEAWTGAALAERQPALGCAEDPRAFALELAQRWSRWPAATLRGLAELRARTEVDAEEAGEPSQPQGETPTLPLSTHVLSARLHADGVAVIELHDREARNMFSAALVDGLKRAFAAIGADASARAVVLCGYDSYFATGGTRDTLLAIQEGQARFTDETVFQAALECALPVVAAVQGHAIGGGWAFAMFADLAVLSAESRYLSPYMGYGFTPGAGSTLVFPARIGHDLARETLLGAGEIAGSELRERGVALPVAPRRDTVAQALALAQRLAAQPRERLIAVKRAGNRALRAARAAVYQRELDMHAATFVGDARTLGLIESKFGAAAPQTPHTVATVSVPPTTQVAATDIGAVVERLRQLLAQELFLQPQEIDDTTPFIDLGLDSITGVTFIRKINAHYGVEIEATKVYSLPTLRALAGHVAGIAGAGAGAAVSAPVVAPAAAAVVAPAVLASAGGEGEGALLAQVIERLRDLLARELHLHAEEIGETTPFIDLGLDSITGVTWVRKINERYGIEIEATKVYSHPTLAGIGRYVLAEALRAGTLATPAVSTVPMAAPAAAVAAPHSDAAAFAKSNALVSWRRTGAVVRSVTAPAIAKAPAANPMTRPIAVIGMAGQFPQARDLNQFWRNLAEGRDCIGEVGAQRWSLDAHYRPGAATPGYSYAKWLGALDDFDRFDPLFFNISPTEAESMDPQQRLFLQACWQSLENAGVDPQTLAGRDCGVFVGCGPSDYHQQSQAQRLSAQGFTGAATSILAARIAYFLNLRGPCLSVDTACSSSLVAIANACDSLNAGHSELALAGGVYVMGGPSMHIMTSQAGMLSADGRCYSFDQRANGFVPGEGVGVLLLKRLEDAQRDGDRIDAVIEGWGVNQDGRSNGITAPNEDAQTRLLQSVYRRFGIDPGSIGLIEAHGTGTKLGDPIEVAALKAAFAPFTQRAGYCALGSVKSNIGHCLTAAGAAGTIKLALALRHRQLPPSANFRQRNEHIRLDGSPFFVSERLREWDTAADAPRRGAVSSFGFSGTNAHLVLSEYVADAAAPARALDERGEYPLVLSARTEEQLRQRARDLLGFLRRSDVPAPDLLEIAYTLQTGREAMGERLGIMAGSIDGLAAKLQSFLDGRDDVPGLFQAQVRRHREGLQLISQDADLRATLIGKWLEQGRLSKLLELWCKGLELDWNALYGAQRPRRIELPEYPFARQRYWLEPEAAAAPAAVVAATASAVVPAVAAPPAVHPARDSLSYVRQWEELPAAPATPTIAAANVLIVLSDACHGLERDLIEHHRRNGAERVRLLSFGAETAPLDAEHWQCGLYDAQAFARALADLPRVDALYFLAASERAAHSDDDAETCQRRNERALLRLSQTLRREAKLGDSLDAYVLTLDNHPPHGDAGRSWGAGASGLAHALAQGQHRWRVRNLDLSSDDLTGAPAARAAALAAILAEPASDRGELIRLQAGKRYRQGFLRLDWGDAAPASDARAAFKHGGVYLIVGGSGIVGRIVTRELIGRYRAQVVWIGRSPADAPRIRAAFDQFGAALSYVQADALDEAALRAALARIQRECGRIDGAVFSGMEFGADDAAEAIDEDAFARIVAVKTQGVRAFHRAVRGEALDFVCYFSSGQAYAFSGAARLSAYASGIGHADAFVRSVRGECGFPVGILNWGFWQAAVDERIGKLERVSTRSLDALGDAEGFDCFERFIAELQRGRVDQALCMRASPEVEALMRCDAGQYLRLDAPQAAREVALDEAALAIDANAIAATVAAHAERGLEPWFARLLRAQLERMAGPALAEAAHSAEQLQRRCAIQDKYLPWLRASLELLAAHNLAELDADGALLPSAPLDADALWAQWRERLPGYLADPQSRALAELSDECLRRLPEILRGGLLATDVLFPNGSMDKVAGLYRDNATADTFNDLVAEAVAAYVCRRRERDPSFRLRLLEIGAGTGGTSKRVFERLRPLREAVECYCYTDLSKAFFLHAQRNYLPEHPYIVCQRLDIEQPVEAQGIAACDYDLVIATNALHATGDIRRTLRHAKTALRAGGRLIVSEMSDKSLSTHLSFGLLDGWWLFRDAELRVPGCPGLAPATWQRVLEQEGFDQVALPAPQAQALGNQVVIARSDGAVRRVWSAAETPAQPVAVAAAAPPPRATVRTASPPRDPAAAVREGIVECLSHTLKMDAAEVAIDIAFSDYGIDSILGVAFIERVNQRFGTALNTAVVFEFSSIQRLTAHLLQAHAGKVEAALATAQQAEATNEASASETPIAVVAPPSAVVAAPVAASSIETPAADMPIAIIGLSGQFPKAGDADTFWANLIGGVDGVEELPPAYLRAEDFSADKRRGKTRCKWGGVLAERDCFDPLFFNISPKEAESMNPHQRLVMQESWKALEDAGYDPKSLAGSRTGIYIGAEPAGYIGDSFTGLSDAIIASRLSYALDFNGPAFVVNTGCSSSAVAIHLACESLRNGECDLVLAGGVNACMNRKVLLRLDEIEMLSPSGRCFTFDRAGDGTIISEGVGMLVLKRLDRALADGDPIYATVRASGMNQDGASNGITAPNGAAQERLILDTYRRFGIEAGQIGYVEAHGTGTRLGDPVETNALVRAFGRDSGGRAGWCALGSAKSHVGHAAAAAGVIGVIKVLLSMRHGRLPGLLNFRELNPLIELDGSPFYINTQAIDWRGFDGAPRMAALNSFGHSGTNAHLVLQEHVTQPVAPRPVQEPLALPLSARSEEQLLHKARDLLAFVEARGEGFDLRAAAHTLQSGREAMEERLGILAASPQQLIVRLREWLRDGTAEGCWRGRARRGQPARVEASEAGAALQAWAQGAAVDWTGLWRGDLPRRMRLPVYPFAKERYWIDSAFESDGSRTAVAASAAAAAVPASAGADSIDAILGRLEDEALDTDDAVKLLRALV